MTTATPAPSMTNKPAHFQPWFTPQEFRSRHARIYDAIGPDAVAIVQGFGPVLGFEVFRQSNEFFFLSGVEVPQAYLLLDGRTRRSKLYMPHRDAKMAASEGGELAAEDGELLKRITGFDAVGGIEGLQADLKGVTVAYVPHNAPEGTMACQDTLRHAAKLVANDPWDTRPTREGHFISLLRERIAGVEVRDLSPILDRMRIEKSPAEVEVMRRAGELTAIGVIEAIKSTRAGLYEYQVGAVADYIYRVNGARGWGYRPIIATGRNIWFAHYYRNNTKLQDGDWVLMDLAPDFWNYTSDIGRMFPVNGRYSDVQRQLYGFMTEFHKALLKSLRPGIMGEQVVAEAVAATRPLVDRTKWAKPIYEAAARRVLEFPNHLTHPVGMAVHDVGTYRDRPLEVGLVFALDPQMWIPEEQIYVRVEDTVVLTESGVESLTRACPLELDEIESLMRQEGITERIPPLPASLA